MRSHCMNIGIVITFVSMAVEPELSNFSLVLLHLFSTQTSFETRSHPEMVGDMSHVTLNFDLSKIPFMHF